MRPSAMTALRDRLGKLSVSEFSRRTGLNRRTIASYEAGDVPIPRYVALACQALANGLPPME